MCKNLAECNWSGLQTYSFQINACSNFYQPHPTTPWSLSRNEQLCLREPFWQICNWYSLHPVTCRNIYLLRVWSFWLCWANLGLAAWGIPNNWHKSLINELPYNVAKNGEFLLMNNFCVCWVGHPGYPHRAITSRTSNIACTLMWIRICSTGLCRRI